MKIIFLTIKICINKLEKIMSRKDVLLLLKITFNVKKNNLFLKMECAHYIIETINKISELHVNFNI